MDKPSYYAIVPATVRYDNNLKANEKLLFGEITCLSNSKGNCWASNTYFSKLYNVRKNTVSQWVQNLKKRGYINIELIYGENKNIEKRIITLGVSIKKEIPTSQKEDRGITKNIERVSRKKDKLILQENIIKSNKQSDNGSDLKILTSLYTQLYKAKYNLPPNNYSLITKKTKDVLTVRDLTYIEGALKAYFADPDSFIEKQSHSMQFFVSKIDFWGKKIEKPDPRSNKEQFLKEIE